MKKLTHLSLFSGIGGLDLAAEWAGFTTVFQCENADYPTRILEKHWPGAPRWGDIRTLTGEIVYERTGLQSIDALSAGVPCQPASIAGKRRGADDDRWLWGEALRIIHETKPAWAILENPDGLLTLQQGMAFENIALNLENQGYEVQTFIIPACGVGAPHRRYRVAIVAHRDGVGSDARRTESEGRQWEARPADGGDDVADAGHAESQGRNEAEGGSQWEARRQFTSRGVSVAHAAGEQDRRVQQPWILPDAGTVRENVADAALERRDRAMRTWDGRPRSAERRDVEHAGGAGCEELVLSRIPGEKRFFGGGSDADGEYERLTTQPCVGEPPYGPTEWLARPVNAWDCDWDNIPRVATGVPDRVNKLKALGNTVVPQQFYPIFAAIAEIERCGLSLAKSCIMDDNTP